MHLRLDLAAADLILVHQVISARVIVNVWLMIHVLSRSVTTDGVLTSTARGIRDLWYDSVGV